MLIILFVTMLKSHHKLNESYYSHFIILQFPGIINSENVVMDFFINAMNLL